MILLEINGNGLAIFVFGIMFAMLSPAIILFVLGALRYKSRPDHAKKLWGYAVIYLLIGGGVCATLLGF